MFKGINAIEFNKRFSSNEACYQYLIEIKWGKGFICSRCGCSPSYKGKTYYYRRCVQCHYNESVTSNTIFHGIKMPILKAFHMVFRLTDKKKGMSTMELGSEVGVQQKTAWLFKRKVQVAMKQDHTDKLKGNVDVDETLMGHHTDRKTGGRSLEKREAIMLGVEILTDGRTGNIRMEHLEKFEELTMRFSMRNMVNSSASIRTDNYVCYRKMKEAIPNIETIESKNGVGFEELHRQIMQFKNWLVGIHHRWSKTHLFAYLDEYVFRFNRRNNRKLIFGQLINRMMIQIPHPYPILKGLCAYST